MPPMVLDDLARQETRDTFYSQTGSMSNTSLSTFKHPVPFRASSAEDPFPARFSHEPRHLKNRPYSSGGLERSASEAESEDERGRRRLRSTSRPITEQNKRHREETIRISEADIEKFPPIYPESLSKHFKPPIPPCTESKAVQDLLVEIKESQQATSSGQLEPDFIEFELSDFTIYLPPSNKAQPYELRGLQQLATRIGHSSFLFDGILSVGNSRRYVRAVPFQICSIGNYGEDIHDVGSDIWLQSDHNTKTDIYYRLKEPAPRYKLYHDGFLWLANLAKHFVDFCQAAPEGTVSIHNFRSEFSIWAKRRHETSPNFQNWYMKYGKNDFRTHVTVNIRFLFKESVGVNPELRLEPIFNEIMDMNSIPQQKLVEQKTIVTPYVYECFKHLRFGDHLEPMDIAAGPREQQVGRGASLNLTMEDHVLSSHIDGSGEGSCSQSAQPSRVIETRAPHSNQVTGHRRMINSIKSGDVLSVLKDGKDSLWKDEVSQWKTADACWYICVQTVYKLADGSREFDAIWLYKPSDTSCAKMKYPFSNELFMSDNCTCEQKRIADSEVLQIIKVNWNGAPSEKDSRIFIRQTYLENERFVTFSKAHKKCRHLAKGSTCSTLPKYQVGQTVLAIPLRKTKNMLEPYEIVELVDGGTEEVAVLRRLQRRQAVDGKGRPNELVYTDLLDRIPTKKIEGACLVRFYRESDIIESLIPAPYCRDGIGNAFYITTRLVQVNGMGTLQPIEHDSPSSLIQGFDPLKNSARLRGLDLYCGGGNFGRGLEEGGAVHNQWAVDINRAAIHTYAANLEDPQGTELFFGSVDDMLSQALKGNPSNSDLIPAPGDVEVVTAGSPCQGYSLMNQNRNNIQGLKNQSLVASVAAYIDFYRPKYGLLENVMSMAQKGRGRDEDVLSQLICTIVGLGYQLRMFVVDAWSCGMPQSRTRLFVSFAAPGLTPLEHPSLSHSHPTNREQERSLGLMANGEAFGKRLRGPTPFTFVSASSGTADLPDISQGCTYQCIQQPEHVMPYNMTSHRRHQIEAIPKTPRCMNFYKTYSQGLMTAEQKALFCMVDKTGNAAERFSKTSKAWGRIDPKALMPAILSRLHVSDARNGPCIHWDEDRILTILEVKRAQGFLDNDAIVGNNSESFKIIGNSVARGVALALGLSLNEARMKDASGEPEPSASPIPVIHEDKERIEGRRIHGPSRRSKHTIAAINEPSEGQETTSGTVSGDDWSDSDSYTTAPDRPIRIGIGSRSGERSRVRLSATASAGGVSSSSSRDVGRYNAAQHREIRASSESSMDHDPVSEAEFNDFINYIASYEKEKVPTQSSSTTGIKRSFDVMEPTVLESRKIQRPSSQDLRAATHYPPVSPSRNGTDKRIDPAVLADRLADLVPQSRGYLDSDSDEDVKFIPAATYSLSAAKSSHTIWQKLPVQATKSISKSKVVISLLSDDEDEVPRSSSHISKQKSATNKMLASRERYSKTLPSYVPVDNSSLNVYAQMNSYMKYDANRRHGPKSTW